MAIVLRKPYPLDWPPGQARTPSWKTRSANYSRNRSLSAAAAEVMGELRRLGAEYGAVLSTNVPVRRDGLPYSDTKKPDDPGAALYFNLHGEEHVLAADKWDRVEHNVWALALHIEALRALERTGVGTQAQAFAGYKALPAPALPEVPKDEPWPEILHVSPDAPVEVIRAAFRSLAAKAHSDAGGSDEAMARLIRARDAALAERGASGATP